VEIGGNNIWVLYNRFMIKDEVVSRSDIGMAFHNKFALKDELAANRLDVTKSYPQFIPGLHGPLSDLVSQARERATKIEIDRKHEVERIARFLGFTEGVKFATTSAGEAIHTVLDYFSHPGNEVIIPDGSYARFPDFVASLPEERVLRWVDTEGLKDILAQNSGGKNERIVLIEEPRQPTFARPDSESYKLIAEPRAFCTVIYDGVNFVFDEGSDIQRTGKENRLHHRDDGRFSRAENWIQVASLSKALPAKSGQFPNVGIIAISIAVDSKDLERFQKGISRKTSQSPPDSELFAMAELLHSSLFPQFIIDLRAIARSNFEYLRDGLKTSVVYDGLNAFVKIDLKDFEIKPEEIGTLLKEFGLHALYSQLYFRKSTSGMETWVRVPLVVNDREGKLSQLETKLKAIQRLRELTRDTKGIIINTFDGWSDGR